MQNSLNIEEIKTILKKYKPEKAYLIKALHDLQNASLNNSLPYEILDEVCKYFNLTKAQVLGVVTYYSMFSIKSRSKYVIRLCKSPVCFVKGTLNILEYLKQKHNILPNSKNNELFALEFTECLGLCNEAPAMQINEKPFTNLNESKIDEIINFYKSNLP
jgi:NADH:ubiquinone oxidoreductase subunit E